MEEIEIKNVSEEEYAQIKETIKQDNQSFKDRGIDPYVTFINYYSQDLLGIYFKNTLVGLVNLGYFRGDLEIQIYVLPSYRGHNIAYLATNKIVNENSINYPTCREIICQVEFDNASSVKVMEKLGWRRDYEHEEAIDYEEDTSRYVFYTLNPHYEKERGITK